MTLRSSLRRAGGAGGQLTWATLAYALSLVLARGLVFLLVPIYTHAMDTDDYGGVTTLNAAFVLIGVIANGGLDYAAIRWYGRATSDDERLRVMTTATVLQYGLTLLVVGVMIAVAVPVSVLVGIKGHADVVVVAALALFPTALANSCRVWFRVQRRLMAHLVLNVLIAATTVAGAIVFVPLLDLGVMGVFLATLLGSGVGAAVAAIAMRGTLRPRGWHGGLARELLAFGLPVIPGAAAMWVIDVADRFWLAGLDSGQAVARYQVAVTVSAVVSLSVGAFEQAWLPHLSSVHTAEDMRRIGSRTALLYAGPASGLALTVSVLSPVLTAAVAPDAYAVSELVVCLLAFSYVFVGLRILANSGPFVGGSLRGLTLSLAAGAIVNTIANLALIPLFGLTGAAIATLAAQVAAAAVAYAVAERTHRVGYALATPLGLLAFAFALALLHGEAEFGRAVGAVTGLALVAGYALVVVSVHSAGRENSRLGRLLRRRAIEAVPPGANVTSVTGRQNDR